MSLNRFVSEVDADAMDASPKLPFSAEWVIELIVLADVRIDATASSAGVGKRGVARIVAGGAVASIGLGRVASPVSMASSS